MMLKYSFFLGFSLFLSSTVFSQTNGIEPDPDLEAKAAVARIVAHTGLSTNFTITEQPTNTAVAYVKKGRRYIGYNRDFIGKLRERTHTDWGAMAVLAHEVGHHLLGHTLRPMKRCQDDELKADRFSGFILCRMGATLEEAQSGLFSVRHEIDTIHHPAIERRMEAIAEGWNQAQQLENDRLLTQSNQPVSSSNYVYKCHFKHQEEVFFIDEDDRLIRHNNAGKPEVVGHITRYDDKSYLFTGALGKISFGVDAEGTIWEETSFGQVFRTGKVFPLN